MHFPGGGKELRNVFVGKKIRRALRAVQNAQFPFLAHHRHEFGGNRSYLGDIPCAGVRQPHVQYIARPQSASPMAAELAKSKSRTAAEVRRHVEAAAYA